MALNMAEFARMWNQDGSVGKNARRWNRVRDRMGKAFPTYYSTPKDNFAREVTEAIRLLDKLKPGPFGPAYLGDDPGGPDYADVTEAELAPDMADLDEVVQESVALFEGMPNWNHPLMMPNVIPPANKAAIIAAMMTDVFGPNIIYIVLLLASLVNQSLSCEKWIQKIFSINIHFL